MSGDVTTTTVKKGVVPATPSFSGTGTTSNESYELYGLDAGEANLPVSPFGKTQKPSGIFAGAHFTTLLGAMQWFAQQSPIVVEEIQAQLLQSGLLTTSANTNFGTMDPATLTAFRNAVKAAASSNGTYSLSTWLNLATNGVFGDLGGTSGSFAGVDQRLRALYNTKPKTQVDTLTNSNDIANIFNQAYRLVNAESPTAQQTAAFVKEYQQAQLDYESGKDAASSEAEGAYLNRANTEASAINNMATMGVKDYVTAYEKAMTQGEANTPANLGPLSNPYMRSATPGLSSTPTPAPQITPPGGGSFHIATSVWQQTVKEMFGAAANRYSNQGTTAPAIQAEVLKQAVQDAYNQTGDWTQVTFKLLTGSTSPSNASGNPISGFVNKVLAEINQNAAQILSQASGGAINTITGQITPQTIVTTPQEPSLSGMAVAASQSADPSRQYANDIANTYGAIISRMFRPGGFSSYTDTNASTGADYASELQGLTPASVTPSNVPPATAAPTALIP